MNTSKNRSQIKTGLRAILSAPQTTDGAAPSLPPENHEPASPTEPVTALHEVRVSPTHAEPAHEARAYELSDEPSADPSEHSSVSVIAPASEPATTSTREESDSIPSATPRPLRKPPARQKEVPLMGSPASRVGTLEQPYLRQRDNRPTRKLGVVLPVDLTDRLQIQCVRTRQRPNAFIEAAVAAALEEQEPRRGR
jgi:hypothetical protein